MFKKKIKDNLAVKIMQESLYEKNKQAEFDRRLRESAKIQFIQK